MEHVSPGARHQRHRGKNAPSSGTDTWAGRAAGRPAGLCTGGGGGHACRMSLLSRVCAAPCPTCPPPPRAHTSQGWAPAAPAGRVASPPSSRRFVPPRRGTAGVLGFRPVGSQRPRLACVTPAHFFRSLPAGAFRLPVMAMGRSTPHEARRAPLTHRLGAGDPSQGLRGRNRQPVGLRAFEPLPSPVPSGQPWPGSPSGPGTAPPSRSGDISSCELRGGKLGKTLVERKTRREESCRGGVGR